MIQIRSAYEHRKPEIVKYLMEINDSF
jgi:hypothetical protein